jgi:hypothetical protein
MPRTENRPANLKCNNGHQFVASVSHEAVESDEQGVIGWVPASNAAGGITCPVSDSRLIRLQ